MTSLYVVCLAGGVACTLLFAALSMLGGAHPHLHSGVHGHTHAPASPALASHTSAYVQGPGHGQGTAHAHASALGQSSVVAGILGSAAVWTLSWLNPLVFAAAALWFGAVGTLGTILTAPLGPVLGVALVAGLLGAGAVCALMASLARASTPPLQARAEGAVGVLNASIRSDGPGEVLYMLEGLQRSLSARAVDGALLPRGTAVMIVRRERGMAFVVPTDPRDALEPNTPAPAAPLT